MGILSILSYSLSQYHESQIKANLLLYIYMTKNRLAKNIPDWLFPNDTIYLAFCGVILKMTGVLEFELK